MVSLKQTLIERDDITPEEADLRIADAKKLLSEYLSEDNLEEAQNIMEAEFGLEPDYIFDLLD